MIETQLYGRTKNKPRNILEIHTYIQMYRQAGRQVGRQAGRKGEKMGPGEIS